MDLIKTIEALEEIETEDKETLDAIEVAKASLVTLVVWQKESKLKPLHLYKDEAEDLKRQLEVYSSQAAAMEDIAKELCNHLDRKQRVIDQQKVMIDELTIAR